MQSQLTLPPRRAVSVFLSFFHSFFVSPCLSTRLLLLSLSFFFHFLSFACNRTAPLSLLPPHFNPQELFQSASSFFLPPPPSPPSLAFSIRFLFRNLLYYPSYILYLTFRGNDFPKSFEHHLKKEGKRKLFPVLINLGI